MRGERLRLCWRCWTHCRTPAASTGSAILWGLSWDWRYAPCCAEPAVCTPLVRWGRDQGREVSQALGFTRDRTPCVSTLHQVFSRLRESFESALGKWLQERGLRDGEALAIDGKRLRGIHGRQLPGLHLVAAYAHQSGMWWGSRRWGGEEE